MACVCASAITAELADWVALGGGNSGCCGDPRHTYGFHCPGYAVSTSDYSRRHEAGRPYNMNWASAGDFAHRGNPTLRAMHAAVLARLMRGELPMIAEFIGKPWADRPVYYWAQWNGVGVLKRYTGAGHDSWSHISWWRSRAHQRAFLWRTATPIEPFGPSPVTPTPEKTSYPPYPGYPLRYNPTRFDRNFQVWQKQMARRGWNLGRWGADGKFGNDMRAIVLAFQREKRLAVDGEIGPITWRCTWTAPITR